MAIIGNRRDGNPIVLNDDGSSTRLRRIPFTEKLFAEDFLQELIKESPEILPISDIDDSFNPPISIGREMESGSGPMDNVLINPDGNITIVETKLQRNPEARREVVGQIIDYAKSVSSWTFDNLDERVKENSKQYHGTNDGVIDILRRVQSLDESEEQYIIDNISRNLSRGRFLLLVVGDGIRESVEEMAEYLQQTPQLQFTLALVELKVYELGEKGKKPLVVYPEIVARTREIIRAVVKVEGASIDAVQISLDTEDIVEVERKPGKRYRLTEEEYFQRLANEVNPDDIKVAKAIINDTQNIGCNIDWKQGSYVVKLRDPGGSGQNLSLYVVSTYGRTDVSGELYNQLKVLGLPQDISRQFAQVSSKLFDKCEEGKYPGNWSRGVALSEIRQHYDEFMLILESIVSEIRKASFVE